MNAEAFFAYARERQQILIRRRAGLPRSEWTKDEILRTYRFCNVFREDDATTTWFREKVRDRMRHSPDVLLATVLFRWFNRMSTGEALFCQRDLLVAHEMYLTPFEYMCWDQSDENTWKTHLKDTILKHCGKGPYVTGSYIIKTPDGMSKLDGVLWCVHSFASRTNYPLVRGTSQGRNDWLVAAQQMLEWRDECPYSLEKVWDWLRGFRFLGDFMAYEVVSDLRYTDLLDKAPDIMTWANPGPGAMRGLNRIHGRKVDKSQPKAKFIEEMRELLAMSQQPKFWPKQQAHDGAIITDGYLLEDECGLGRPGSWPKWDMRTVEHTLCEFAKYERGRDGQPASRQRFR